MSEETGNFYCQKCHKTTNLMFLDDDPIVKTIDSWIFKNNEWSFKFEFFGRRASIVECTFFKPQDFWNKHIKFKSLLCKCSNGFLEFINRDINLEEDKTKRYIIKKELGKGGYGNIFLAYDNEENREIIIKRISKSQINNEIFNREVKAMKDVKCDYSVEIYDNYSDEKFYYIVMEKCDEDLYDLLEKKANGLSESKIKDIFLELNVVFKKMNSKNIIHRDLKPENIFIKYNYQNNEDFVVKLGDFGLSREYHQKKFSTCMGT